MVFRLNVQQAASKHPRADCTLYSRIKQTAMKIFYMRLSPSIFDILKRLTESGLSNAYLANIANIAKADVSFGMT